MPGFIAESSASGDATSIAVGAPSGVQSGDYQLAFFLISTTSETAGGAPTGWTQISSVSNTSSDTSQLLVYESTTATGSSSFTKSGTRGALVIRCAWNNHTGRTVAAATTYDSTSATTHTTPSVTPTSNNSLVIGCCTFDVGSTSAAPSFTPPSGWTERSDVTFQGTSGPDRLAMTVADFAQSTAAAITGTFTVSTANAALLAAVVLNPGATQPPRFFSQYGSYY